MVPIEQRSGYRWRRNYARGHVCWTKIGTAMLGLELSLYIDACADMSVYTEIPRYKVVRSGASWVESPFSSRMRSSSEFLYLSMRHSSAAVRCAALRLLRVCS